MKDEWDSQFSDTQNEAYKERIKKINFNCELILSLKKIFFSTGLNKYVEDELLHHLFTCSKCRKVYNSYAKEIGFKDWSLPKYAVNFVLKNKEIEDGKTKAFLEIKDKQRKDNILSKPWTFAATNFDINKLMGMRVFHDLCLEYDSPTGQDHTEFVKHIVLKNAKRIDYLEECLLKEEESKHEV